MTRPVFSGGFNQYGASAFLVVFSLGFFGQACHGSFCNQKAPIARLAPELSLPRQNLRNTDKVKHVFVLMLENRSYDHIFGCSNFEGQGPDGSPARADGLTGQENNIHNGETYYVTLGGQDRLDVGPPHHFDDMYKQLGGICPVFAEGESYPVITNTGYVASYASNSILFWKQPKYPGAVMEVFRPDQLPYMNALAKSFAVADRWHASVPGPTFPNLFFAHAATSGGSYDQLTGIWKQWKSCLNNEASCNMHNNLTPFLRGHTLKSETIFKRMAGKKGSWRVYYHDFPATALLNDLRHELKNSRMPSGRHETNPNKHFRKFGDFIKDLAEESGETFPQYVYIEPKFGAFNHFKDGNSMHPEGAASAGDAIVKKVYEAIRRSKFWNNSLLIITFDEGGGILRPCHPAKDRPSRRYKKEREIRFLRSGRQSARNCGQPIHQGKYGGPHHL